eukprot:TRINITY_DN79153_c0_g1_i1.p1 TRINITY_DN79153_c0_g1~~TRINITY_DN79153_c0_g1_i1.p1  ORF type:complete len:216 (+),score=64.93 TRINITY_DN79153_c0_g1_i1:67-714(+)
MFSSTVMRATSRAVGLAGVAAAKKVAINRRSCRLMSMAISKTAAWRFPAASSAVTRRCFSTVEIKTPDFGAESITEGTLMEWQVKEGEFAAEGTLLVSIETDKVTTDVKAPQNGTLVTIKAKADETVEVGQVLCVFSPGGEAPPKAAAAPTPTPTPTPAAAPSAAAATPAPAAAPSTPTPTSAPTAYKATPPAKPSGPPIKTFFTNPWMKQWYGR